MTSQSRSAWLSRNFSLLVAFVAIVVMLGGAHMVRYHDIRNEVGVQNMEAPWHVLLTVQAMKESPVRAHAFLPIATLGGPHDRGIYWGGAVPDSEGRYYYTSATPPTFVLPYAWFHLLGLEPTMANLANFNFALQIVAVICLFCFLYRLLRALNIDQTTAGAAAAVAMAVCIFSREALLSFGIIYWFHGIYLILLAATLWLILLFITTEEKPPRWLNFAMFAACFLGAWVDWTGFVFNVAAAILLITFYPTRRTIQLAIYMAIGTFAAGVTILVHFGSVIDLNLTLSRMKFRYAARGPIGGNGLSYNILALFQGYALSFGLFFAAILASVIIVIRAKLSGRTFRVLFLMFLLTIVPLSENLILLENSAQYAYERLKFIVPAALLLALGFAYAKRVGRIALALAVGISAVFGVWSYKEENTHYARWNAIDRANVAFKNVVQAQPEYECAALLTNIITRGYATLLFHRMIFEPWLTPEQDRTEYSRKVIERTGACAVIFLEGKPANWLPPFTNMQEYTAAHIIEATGEPRTIFAKAEPVSDVPPSLFVRLFAFGAHRL